GAQQWSYGKRVQFANDPLNLLAVDGPTNAAKGDGDTATWLPPNKTYRCAYVGRQVAVKHRYGVWVTAAEKSAMVRVLSRCPAMRLPTVGPIPPRPVIPAPTHTPRPAHPTPQPRRTTPPPPPRPKPTPTRTTPPSAAPYEGVVHPGAFCAPEGARGVTTKGTPMRCTRKPGEDRARWRSS
ncbi:MAG TPA: HNH endonuclease family protein, partial [Segeticoccus sp.]|uniref:HNH endonuclease family protein n=1 Tax=Segeticoccus sp. TaxID=2706531 RepID=UPI002D802CB4